MKKITLINVCALIFLVFSFSHCYADVYGHLLTIRADDGTNNLNNGSEVRADVITNNKLRFEVKAVDPNNSTREFDVSSWNVKLLNDDGNSFTISKNVNKNVLLVTLVNNDPSVKIGKTINLWAQATIGSELTNSVQFSVVVAADEQATPPSTKVATTLTVVPARVSTTPLPTKSTNSTAWDWKILALIALAIASLALLIIAGRLVGMMPLLSADSRERWGIVFDSKSLSPITGALVAIYALADKKLKASQITDGSGSYGFLVPSGGYVVTVVRSGCVFPASQSNLNINSTYKNCYYGGRFFVHDGEKMEMNIPVSVTSSILPEEQEYIRSRPPLVLSFLQFIFPVAGLIFASYLSYMFKNYNYIIPVVYFMIIIFLDINLLKQRIR